MAVEKDARFYKVSGGAIHGYVVIHDSAEGGRESDYLRTATVLKALGVRKWSKREREIRLAGGRPGGADEAGASLQSCWAVLTCSSRCIFRRLASGTRTYFQHVGPLYRGTRLGSLELLR